MSSLFSELRRRNVFRVGIAYIVLAWLVLQVADVIIGNIAAPEWLFKVLLLFLALGFPFAIFFAWAFELTPEGVKRESQVDRSQSITHQTGRKLDFAIIATLALAVAYFAYDKFMLGSGAGSPATESLAGDVSTPVEESPAESERSIAVLPFVNMSDDEKNEYFSDGISEEILNSLASVRELKVAGRTSSFAFKNKNDDLRLIGDALGVEHILEGSVRKAGTRVRITAQLIQVEDGFHMWSETYDRELDDVFAIQDEIANAILEELKTHLLDGEVTPAKTTPTDPEAYDKFLIAKQRIYERNRASLEAARQLLEEALEIDPQFAPAHAQLGITILLLRDNSYGEIPAEEVLSLSKPHLDTALELAPNLAEGWAGLGLYYGTAGSKRDEAIDALEKALALNPNLIDASNWLQAEYTIAELDKRLPILEDIVSRDPLYRPGLSNLVNLYNSLGMQSRSLTLIRRVERFIADDPWLTRLEARTLADQGSFAEAMPLAEAAARQAPNDFQAQFTFGDLLFRTYQWDRFTEVNLPPVRAYEPYFLGRREEALMAVRELAAQGIAFPMFDILIGLGRYEELVEFVDQNWPDLDAFQAEWTYDGDGYSELSSLAFAYLKTGNNERFADAMARIRKAHDLSHQGGVISEWLDIEEASYYAMAGDIEKAIDYVESAVDKGFVSGLRIAQYEPQLEPLEGDPRYEAAQDRMIEKVNRERAQLGLDPVEA